MYYSQQYVEQRMHRSDLGFDHFLWNTLYYISIIKFHQNSASSSNKWSGRGFGWGYQNQSCCHGYWRNMYETIRVNIPQSSPWFSQFSLLELVTHKVLNRLSRLISNIHCCFVSPLNSLRPFSQHCVWNGFLPELESFMIPSHHLWPLTFQ